MTHKPDSVSALFKRTMAIPLDDLLAKATHATYPPWLRLSAKTNEPFCQGLFGLAPRRDCPFHPPHLSNSLKGAGTRLCGSNPPLARDGDYPLRCPMESGLSSSSFLSKQKSDHPVISPKAYYTTRITETGSIKKESSDPDCRRPVWRRAPFRASPPGRGFRPSRPDWRAGPLFYSAPAGYA